MIVHGMPMRTPRYTEEQAMNTTILRRSIKDDSVKIDKVSDKLGYGYTGYGKPSPSYTVTKQKNLP